MSTEGSAQQVGRATAIDGFRAIANGLPSTSWIADAGGTAQWFNNDFPLYTGVTPQTAVQWGWTLFVHPDDRLALTRELSRCLQKRATLDCNMRLRSAEGTYRWFNARARLLPQANGSATNWLGTFTDVHDRQVAIEAGAHVIDALMKGYLSKKLPVVKGVAFDTHYQAANAIERVGGDWYDAFELSEGRIGFSLGDVCGHGIQAAVKMAEAKQAIFVAASLRDPEPVRVMHESNRVLFLNNHDVSITTALYGMVDTARGNLAYASAGHHPPILVNASGEALILPNHGFPLGVEEQMPSRIKTHEFRYGSGSTMVLYTDGLIEFDRDLIAGEARLLSAASESVLRNVEKPEEFIVKNVLGGSISEDDVAVLTISFE